LPAGPLTALGCPSPRRVALCHWR